MGVFMMDKNWFINMKRRNGMNHTIFKKYTGRTIISKFLFWYTIKAECIGCTTEWMDGAESPEFKYWRKLGKEDIIDFEIKLKDGN